ncbi:hypothetical protein T10_5124 [Trichinella papuae]|uniref:Uncharacterized protein n=1 Tax=Trichinella papuae TaxID=268474 RepID=A0A0V1MPJ6_9BILA|nr:hypothetical protein T10_5124 [Trichinella papuae]
MALLQRLGARFIARLTTTIVSSGVVTFVVYEICSRNEKFHTECLMPALRHLMGFLLGNRQFENCIGLAAEFGTDGNCIGELCKVGFGFVEIGDLSSNLDLSGSPVDGLVIGIRLNRATVEEHCGTLSNSKLAKRCTIECIKHIFNANLFNAYRLMVTIELSKQSVWI